MTMRKSLLSLLLLSSCSLAPDFKLPDMKLPQAFKQGNDPQINADVNANVDKDKIGVWKEAVSLEKEDRGQWWKIFADPTLDDLEKQAFDANQTLKAASARVEQARAQVRANAASFLPDIDIGGNGVRAKSAASSPAGFSPGPYNQLKPYNLYSTGVTASYEADLFNRVRDAETALSYDADAQTALFRGTLLALQADVAQNYFQLQTLDAQRALLKDTVTIRSEAQRIMQKRFKVGSVGAVDVSRTESELAEAKADLINLDRQRAVLENAMAILLGKNPSEYHFAETPLKEATPPFIPAGIPSELLQRRPDISSAASNMEAANTRIGVARAAFFPSITLTASGGTQSTSLGDIFKWSSRTWALGQTAGSAIAMNIFDSGRHFGELDVAHAAYDEAVAAYRQQVLVAMGDVENALTDQLLLADEARQQDIAANATKLTTELTQKRYDEGDANYFEVVDAQRGMLAANRAAIGTHGSRLIATVSLVRALGGGWAEPAAEKPAVETPVAVTPAAEPVAEQPIEKTVEIPSTEPVVTQP